MLSGSFRGTLGALIVPAYSPQSHQILSSWSRSWEVQALVQPLTWDKGVLMSDWSHIRGRELNETRHVGVTWSMAVSPSSGSQGTQ